MVEISYTHCQHPHIDQKEGLTVLPGPQALVSFTWLCLCPQHTFTQDLPGPQASLPAAGGLWALRVKQDPPCWSVDGLLRLPAIMNTAWSILGFSILPPQPLKLVFWSRVATGHTHMWEEGVTAPAVLKFLTTVLFCF